MTTITIPTTSWAALAWTAIPALKSDPRTPVLATVRLDFDPEGNQLTAVATDRYRVHKVTISLPDQEGEPEAFSRVIPAKIIAEAAKHPTVGKARIPNRHQLTITETRIEAGFGGWGSSIAESYGNFPAVERLMPTETPDVECGAFAIRTEYIGDLGKLVIGKKRPDSGVWTLHRTENGPIYATRAVDDGIEAVALIQPQEVLR